MGHRYEYKKVVQVSQADRRRGGNRNVGHRKSRGGRMNGMPLLPLPPQPSIPMSTRGIRGGGGIRPGRGIRFPPVGPPPIRGGGPLLQLPPQRMMGPGPRGPPIPGMRRMPPIMGSGPPGYGLNPSYPPPMMMRPPYIPPLHPPNGYRGRDKYPHNKPTARYPLHPQQQRGVTRRGRFQKKNTLTQKKIDLSKPWVTDTFKVEFTKREELYAIAKNTQNEDDWRNYREQRDKCSQLYKDGEMKHLGDDEEAKSTTENNKFDDRELNDTDSTKVQEVQTA